VKQLFFLAVLLTLVLTGTAAQQDGQSAAAELSFTYTKQRGFASNQYAIWVEDAEGRHIKTIFATGWTANGGWKRRPASIPVWVKQSGLSALTKAQIDVFSGATPGTGSFTYTWDGTDSRDTLLPAGDYMIILEGTLRGENQVYYRAPISLGQGIATPQISVEYKGKSLAERSMIGDVKVRVFR